MATLSVGPAARGEIVRLKVGQNGYGQGWLFLDRDGTCKLLTAGHVVAPEGTAQPVIVLDRRNRELETDPPEVLALPPDADSVTPDLALLPVRKPGDNDQCSRSRLSMIGIDRRVQLLRDGVIETTGRTETQVVPIERTASLRDSAGGEVFTVRPRDATMSIARGWSGSIVRDAEGPLGVVVSTPTGAEAIVLRVDLLARLARAVVPAQTGTGLGFSRINVIRGNSSDAAAGPSGALVGTMPPWSVRPERGWIVVQLAADQPQAVRRVVVELDASAPAVLLGADIEVGLRQPGGLRLQPIRSCRFPAPARRIVCEFLEQTRAVVQVSLLLLGSEPILVRRMSVE